MIKTLLTFGIALFTMNTIAQVNKTEDFSAKNLIVVLKTKSPGMFSKIEKGSILILKIKNGNSASKNVSFKILEYMDVIVKSEPGAITNCIKANKKKKIKVHLENFDSENSYDWIFSNVTVSETELCPKK